MVQAFSRRLPHGAVFSGKTAAWLHGLDLAPDAPIEATIPYESSVSDRAGMSVRRSRLSDSDVDRRRGLPVTSPLHHASRSITDLSLERYFCVRPETHLCRQKCV